MYQTYMKNIIESNKEQGRVLKVKNTRIIIDNKYSINLFNYYENNNGQRDRLSKHKSGG